MTEYKTIRMRKEEYEKVQKARELLLRKGLDKLPEDAFKICPECGTQMEGVDVEYYQCQKCGYKEGRFNITREGIALGAAAAAGAGVLIYGLYKYFKD